MNNIDAFLDYFAVIDASNEAEVKEMDNGLIRVTIKDGHFKLSKMFDPEVANYFKCGGDVLADLLFKDMMKEFYER